MGAAVKEEAAEALQVLSSTINNCQKMQLKFAEGSSQHALLKNRINALYLVNSLITNEKAAVSYTKQELENALHPIASIISKCEKAQLKFPEGASSHTRLKKILKTMYLSKSMIILKINKIE